MWPALRAHVYFRKVGYNCRGSAGVVRKNVDPFLKAVGSLKRFTKQEWHHHPGFKEDSGKFFSHTTYFIDFLILIFSLASLWHSSHGFSCRKCWYVGDYSPQCVCCLFTFLVVSFREEIFSILNSDLLIYSLVACALGVISKKILAHPSSWSFTPMFDSKSCIVLAIIFKFMNYFNFYIICRRDPISVFFASGYLVVLAQFVGRLYVLNCYGIIVKNQFTITYGSYLGFQFYSTELYVYPQASPTKSRLI